MGAAVVPGGRSLSAWSAQSSSEPSHQLPPFWGIRRQFLQTRHRFPTLGSHLLLRAVTRASHVRAVDFHESPFDPIAARELSSPPWPAGRAIAPPVSVERARARPARGRRGGSGSASP